MCSVKWLYNMFSKALYWSIDLTSEQMAPPLSEALLFTNMQSVASMSVLFCAIQNKAKVNKTLSSLQQRTCVHFQHTNCMPNPQTSKQEIMN